MNSPRLVNVNFSGDMNLPVDLYSLKNQFPNNAKLYKHPFQVCIKQNGGGGGTLIFLVTVNFE